MLPFSHDEVVYGKQSLIYRMPGDEWQRFANLRLLFGYMFTHPGTNLIFMGGEFGQTSEWNFEQSLDWHLTQYDFHKGIQEVIKDLNALYKKHPALHEKQFSPEGFEWIDYGDAENSVLTFIRKGSNPKDDLVIALNFTPIPRENYRVGTPKSTQLKLLFNSDDKKYGGSGVGKKTLKPSDTAWHGHKKSVVMTLPPLGALVYK
ncbi:MAG: hypothetical protein CMH45_04070 [Muricauda sp.]|nr:hypothetical protein [Allomuricauda sp.]